MNINGVSNPVNIPQQVGLVTGAKHVDPTEDVSLQGAIASEVKTTEKNVFYEYQKEPWLLEPINEHITNRLDYVAHKKRLDVLELALVNVTFDSFRKQLQETHPDIARKNFGFTLTESASIKIIDYDNSLTENDTSVLTHAINGFREFKEQLQHHAKTIMTLVDHDHETFGGRYKLDISNFQDVIDYGKIMNTSVQKMQDEWIQQVQSNAEKRDFSYISLAV
ncbi:MULTISPECIES: hypothetical protein [Pseudomonas syringae group]|uniref:Uncharacterized protein n=2 Tax=Pseudomonas syringae group TaxID=136849 RepID=A0A2V4R737_PSESJ|nr:MULTISPECIES: hypothetical protein [Pseudomonas syringae group]PYD17969.1 hypothetical protein DND62_00835 [Pseudomonas syringae pv. pisi]PYD32737.1 hypothetical protein DND58_04925 [Pseudomonas syringae pv. pisi]PYD35401.1 hypothetical protein DND67_05620 [Pseudomonas syringae pv. pisi]RML57225.1 hypothetical protein ALQ93_01755 [Pseudomonas syringae pv. pisi]RML65981.1 hypothetical protein ALQ92_03425 [Pseudomonas syringae pv. pisi]